VRASTYLISELGQILHEDNSRFVRRCKKKTS
jgi:hypothetical protein